MQWTDERLDDLDDLKELIREARSIDSGSSCLKRIARVIELADKLDRTSLVERRLGFVSFLQDLARDDRAKQPGAAE